MDTNLYENLRHLKDFKEITSKSKKDVWRVNWPNGQEIQIRRAGDLVCLIPNHDIQLATYICALHNMSERLIRETENK